MLDYVVLRSYKRFGCQWGKIFVGNLSEGKFGIKAMDFKDLDKSMKLDIRCPTTFNIM